MTQQSDLKLPWSLRFDSDGTEDVAIICDAEEGDLVRSRAFWLPREDDPMPPMLAVVQLMVTAPKLLASLITCANLLADYDESDGSEGEAFREALAAIMEATRRPA